MGGRPTDQDCRCQSQQGRGGHQGVQQRLADGAGARQRRPGTEEEALHLIRAQQRRDQRRQKQQRRRQQEEAAEQSPDSHQEAEADPAGETEQDRAPVLQVKLKFPQTEVNKTKIFTFQGVQ